MVAVNWHRVAVFWEFVAAYFGCLLSCRETAFRGAAAEAFNSVIEQGFKFFARAYPAKLSEGDEGDEDGRISCWSREHWQESLLQPVHEVVRVQFGNTRQQVLQGVLRLLQNNGHEFTQCGLESVVRVLALCSEPSETGVDPCYVTTGFQVLELLIQQYLHALPPTITKELLPLIAGFRAKTTEPNISFISVGLIWQLADNLSKQRTPAEQLEELWTAVLVHLKDLSLDAAPDVRQSALHIIAQVTLINCASFRVDYQVALFRDVLLCVFDALIGRLAQLQRLQGVFHLQTPRWMTRAPHFPKFSEEELTSQRPHEAHWEDTLKLVVQSLAKVVKKLQLLTGYE